MEFFDVFNDERMLVSFTFLASSGYGLQHPNYASISFSLFQMLHDACRRVQRDLTLQFGRLRGFGPATVSLQLGVVRILGNKTSPLRTGARQGDYRVFLWKGRILTRSEYLKMNHIVIDGFM